MNPAQLSARRKYAAQVLLCRPALLDRMATYKRFCLGQYLQGTKQVELAKILDITQPSVQSLLQQTLFWCVEMSQLPPRPSEKMAKRAFRCLPERQQEIMLLMFRHGGSQTEVAEELGRSQGYVRHWYMKGLNGMEEGRVRDWMWKVKQLASFQRSKFFVGRLPFSIPSGSTLLVLAKQVLQDHKKSRTRVT